METRLLLDENDDDDDDIAIAVVVVIVEWGYCLYLVAVAENDR